MEMQNKYQVYHNSFLGQREIPRMKSSRIIFITWWTFTVVIVATYTGNLVAFLTVVKIYPPFRSLAELVEQDEYLFGTLGSGWATVFKVRQNI